MKPDFSLVLKSGHFHLLTTLTGCRRLARNSKFLWKLPRIQGPPAVDESGTARNRSVYRRSSSVGPAIPLKSGTVRANRTGKRRFRTQGTGHSRPDPRPGESSCSVLFRAMWVVAGGLLPVFTKSTLLKLGASGTNQVFASIQQCRMLVFRTRRKDHEFRCHRLWLLGAEHREESYESGRFPGARNRRGQPSCTGTSTQSLSGNQYNSQRLGPDLIN